VNGTFTAACLADGAKSQKPLTDARAQREADRALQAVCNAKLSAKYEELKKASDDAKVAADATYSAAVAAAEAAATKQCDDAKKSILKDELRKAAIIPTANRYTMEYAGSPTGSVLPGRSALAQGRHPAPLHERRGAACLGSACGFRGGSV